MARRTSIFRQLALAKALAEGMPEREIARKFADEWHMQRDSVHVMLKKLLRTWTQEPRDVMSNSLSPWKTSPKARERMKVLAEALANGEARRDVVRKYAEHWGLSTEWVDELITRVIVESQNEIYDQAQRALAVYVARIRSYLARYAQAGDYADTSEAYERLALLAKA